MYDLEYIDFLFPIRLVLVVIYVLSVTAVPQENIFYSKLQDSLLVHVELKVYKMELFLF